MCISEYMIEQDEFRLARIAYERQWDVYLEQVIDYHEKIVSARTIDSSIQSAAPSDAVFDLPIAA